MSSDPLQPDPRFPALPGWPALRRMRASLIRWYVAERRDLPWRRSRDAYAIWVSEAMLQQTRVEVVVDYFERFMAAFPTVTELARAQVDDVLALWSGLGYYRRARALHAAAGMIVADFDGSFPRTRAQLLALPGVGPYTAGAVLSIAFDQRVALVDGNVERVFSRLFGYDAPSGSPQLGRALWRAAEDLIADEARAGDWNQALMELGATVCSPRVPQCERCPLAGPCVARATGRTVELPGKKVRPAQTAVELELLCIRARGSWLLERRPQQGRMAGMWQVPTREKGMAAHLFSTAWPSRDGRALVAASDEPALGELRHSITRYGIRARLLAGHLLPAASVAGESAVREPATGLAWVDASELDKLALTGLTKKAIRLATRTSPAR